MAFLASGQSAPPAPGPPNTLVGLPRDRRLRRARDFDQVRTAGRSWAHPLLILRAAPNGSARTRVGVVCGRRIGKAVVRNRVKRRLREIIRQAPLGDGWDVVLIARPAAATADFSELGRGVAELTRRARLQRPPSGSLG
ncbi:MAG TPA: ribonuclease P protein component [Dehalococcoidia bacterium]|nr:ribonuclease P protein component [Dehalococcoidia bacterium]